MSQQEFVTTNIRVPKTHLKALKQEALKKEKSVNFLLRRLIERYLMGLFPEPSRGRHPMRSIWDFPRIARKTGDRHLTAQIDRIVYGKK